VQQQSSFDPTAFGSRREAAPAFGSADDNRYLVGAVLADVLRQQLGDAGFEALEAVRRKSVAFRREAASASAPQLRRELEELLDGAELPKKLNIIRAFSYFSHLLNITEDMEELRLQRAAGRDPRLAGIHPRLHTTPDRRNRTAEARDQVFHRLQGPADGGRRGVRARLLPGRSLRRRLCRPRPAHPGLQTTISKTRRVVVVVDVSARRGVRGATAHARAPRGTGAIARALAIVADRPGPFHHPCVVDPYFLGPYCSLSL
jgi:hypothetical protein